MWNVNVFTILIVALGSAHGSVLPDTRIVNGVDANIEDFPFLVSLRFRLTTTSNQFSAACGGTLIRTQVVLSAAHCFRNSQSDFHESEAWRWVAVAGSSFLNTGGTSRSAAFIQIHPGYNMSTLDFDIGLVVLSSQFSPSSTIGVATVPTASTEIIASTPVQIAGWGALQSSGAPSNRLQSAQVYIIDNQECAANYSQLGYPILPSMFCAGTTHLGGLIRDACQGDSGGPLVYGNMILGVVSWGYQCASPYFPGVYASVPAVSQWIENSIGVFSLESVGANDGISFISNKFMVVLVSIVSMALGASVCG